MVLRGREERQLIIEAFPGFMRHDRWVRYLDEIPEQIPAYTSSQQHQILRILPRLTGLIQT